LESASSLDPTTLNITYGRASLHDEPQCRPTAIKEKRPARLEKSASGSPTRPR
jgi:hypothetical protein